MAYLDLRTAELSGSIHTPFFAIRDAAPQVEAARFSPIEWLVIALAERDRLSSLESPGRIANALASLFGSRGQARLANSQLEALRRLAVMAWHRGFDVPASELAAFNAAGFSTGHAETLLQSVLGRRATRRARNAK